MHNTKILGVTTLVTLTAAVIACRLIPRLDVTSRLLPINAFPRQLQGWHAGADIAADPQVQVKLPTARILERNYINPRGKMVNLMLITATDDEDFHKPTACLPAQGWVLKNQDPLLVAGQKVNILYARRENDDMTVLYYWVKLKPRRAPAHSLLAATLALRKHLVHEEMSLFVRIIMPTRPEDRADLLRFSAQVWQELQPMLGGNGEVVLRS